MADILSEEFDPSKLTPLFTAQFTTCAYPISDLYASSPRYLYYALLALVFLTQWHGWLANVFLGAAATYAGTAAIEAFILITNKPAVPLQQNITIPYIDPSNVKANATLNKLDNLVTGYDWLPITPAALELDVDGILAIVVTGYLMMLPMHCWSSVVKANRARHLLMGIWNLLMLAGTACALVLWSDLYNVPLQFRFCYPDSPDADTVTSDSSALPDGTWQGDWNSTIWNTFQNLNVAFGLSDNCLYPCFNTSQILRRSNSLTASLSSSNRSPRTNFKLSEKEFDKIERLQYLMYVAIVVSATVAVLLLTFTLSSHLRRLTRVPVHRPKELLWGARKELVHALTTDFKTGLAAMSRAIQHPHRTYRSFHSTPSRTILHHFLHALRFQLDILAILLLLFAMILVPATLVVFIVWIEWYIHRDIVSSENPSQVGQWTSSVSIALVLCSAAVLRLKYWIASRQEVEREISETKEKLRELEELAEKKMQQEEDRRRRRVEEENNARSTEEEKRGMKALISEKLHEWSGRKQT